MTAAAFMVVAATLGLVAIAVPTVLSLAGLGGRPGRRMVDLLIGGLGAAFVAWLIVLYVGTTL